MRSKLGERYWARHAIWRSDQPRAVGVVGAAGYAIHERVGCLYGHDGRRGNVGSEEVIIKRLPRTAVPDMLGRPTTDNPMRGKIVDHHPLEGVKLWTVTKKK